MNTEGEAGLKVTLWHSPAKEFKAAEEDRISCKFVK